MIKRRKLGDEEVGEEHAAMAMRAAALEGAQRLKKRVELPPLPAPEKADEGIERIARGRLKLPGAQWNAPSRRAQVILALSVRAHTGKGEIPDAIALTIAVRLTCDALPHCRGSVMMQSP